MNLKSRWLIPITILVLVLAVPTGPTGAQSPSYNLKQWTSAASAGGTGTSSSYTLHGTLGQESVYLSQGASHYAASGGIWRGFSAANILVLDKEYRDDVPPVEAEDELVFVVAVTNNGYRTQEQVVVTDTVPAYFSLVPGSAEADTGTVGVDGNTITLSIDQLTYERIAVLTYRVLVEDDAAGRTITNTAVARSADYGPITDSAIAHVFAPNVVYLPLVARDYPPASVVHDLEDAPDACPGHTVVVGDLYRDDWDFPNDNDWYTFEAISGTIYTIQTSDLQGRADTIVTLYGPGCTVELAQNDDIIWPDDVASRIVWQASADGTYCVMARSYDWQVYGNDTGYTFDVSIGGTGMVGSSGAASPSSKPPSPPTPTPGRPPGDACLPASLPAQKPTPPPTPVPKPPPPPTPGPKPQQPAVPTLTPTLVPLLPETGDAADSALRAGLLAVIEGIGLILIVYMRRSDT